MIDYQEFITWAQDHAENEMPTGSNPTASVVVSSGYSLLELTCDHSVEEVQRMGHNYPARNSILNSSVSGQEHLKDLFREITQDLKADYLRLLRQHFNTEASA